MSDLYKRLIQHYEQTGEIMTPEQFSVEFAGALTAEEAKSAILQFDQYLDTGREGGKYGIETTGSFAGTPLKRVL